MVQRALSKWHRFRSLIMDSGPFALLKEKFANVLETLEELEANGGLQALAEEWAQNLPRP
jgi:phage tail tape-measure protein